jgi:hypothetical protein
VSGIRRWTLTTVSLWSIHTQTCTFQGWTYGFGLFFSTACPSACRHARKAVTASRRPIRRARADLGRIHQHSATIERRRADPVRGPEPELRTDRVARAARTFWNGPGVQLQQRDPERTDLFQRQAACGVILPFVANCQQQWRWKRYRQPSDGQLLLGQPNEFWNDHDPVQADDGSDASTSATATPALTATCRNLTFCGTSTSSPRRT